MSCWHDPYTPRRHTRSNAVSLTSTFDIGSGLSLTSVSSWDTRDIMLYANYSRGYRARSFNAQAFFDPSEADHRQARDDQALRR